MAKTLVIYYSRRGQNYARGSIVNLKKGNTEYIAEFIRDAVSADLFEIRTVKEYSTDYTTCTQEAKEELRNNARPELKEYLKSLDQYDNIVVAGPCWWGTFPCAVFTQLEKLDFTGKKVFSVMTHEGSGMGKSVSSLREYCKNADVYAGIAISGSSCPMAEKEVRDWALKTL